MFFASGGKKALEPAVAAAPGTVIGRCVVADGVASVSAVVVIGEFPSASVEKFPSAPNPAVV